MPNVPNVSPLESSGVDAVLHDYNVRSALGAEKIDEKAVRDALEGYGLKFDDVQWKKIYAALKTIDWHALRKLEDAVGRGTDMG